MITVQVDAMSVHFICVRMSKYYLTHSVDESTEYKYPLPPILNQ